MRITIKLKLGLAFAAVILLSMLTAAFGISTLGALDTSIGEVRRGPVERVLLETELRSCQRDSHSTSPTAQPIPTMPI
jgi:methyl-accepting chemotaxis protein